MMIIFMGVKNLGNQMFSSRLNHTIAIGLISSDTVLIFKHEFITVLLDVTFFHQVIQVTLHEIQVTLHEIQISHYPSIKLNELH